ncbi:hypothetical protein [Streptomyces luteogriseus]|uniref:hypothetical protein n=1 Tax=Streptomyces luteogriseus TaxID=68233 RepID=UPI0037AFECA8
MSENQDPRELGDLAAHWDELEIGVEYPVASNHCRYCQSTDLVLVVKLEAMPGSLAGVQVKTSARKWPYLRCKGCGHESRGQQ